MEQSSLALIQTELPKYGAHECVDLATAEGPRLLNYIDFDTSRQSSEVEKIFPDAVVEWQGRPLLYVVVHDKVFGAKAETHCFPMLMRTLASRGERSYLAVVEPGKLSVYPVNLDKLEPSALVVRKDSKNADSLVPRLALGQVSLLGEPTSSQYVHDEMFALLSNAADELISRHKLSPQDTLSLMGRALFFRFLCDRSIVTKRSLKAIAPGCSELWKCFDTPEFAASTSKWIDDTFNGDALPLSEDGTPAFFDGICKATNSRALNPLVAIMQGHKPLGAGQYQHVVEWARFDFAHVPVGLLSQIYERFSWKLDEEHSKSTSVHYTPHPIASYVVEEVFDGLPDAADARVLDPACGAGVFLVLAFRQLYKARWQQTGHRPGTESIRRILDTQLSGMDISASAIQLAALSLYLTAIELDPNPSPPSKLRFKKLQNRVLINATNMTTSNKAFVPGSLAPEEQREGFANFDVVLGNPPWTSTPDEDGSVNALYTAIGRQALESRNLHSEASSYKNPDNAPDLPFLWKSMSWCKYDGRIAMVLPSRILLKQQNIPVAARRALFRALTVNGIVNCSNLADTRVWPGMNQPFMLLFATNSPPKDGEAFRWITPQYDEVLNRRGEVRVDANASSWVEVDTACKEPWHFKALAIGTALDIEVVRRIRNSTGRPLKAYWTSDLKLACGKGYRVGTTEQFYDADFLYGMPTVTDKCHCRFSVRTEQLPRMTEKRLNRRRDHRIYQPPLVIIPEAIGEDRSNGVAAISREPVAFNVSYMGYSAAGHPDALRLCQYLLLIVHSSIWRYYALVTSSTFGVERRRVNKTELDRFPIIPLERLTDNQVADIGRLAQGLMRMRRPDFGPTDRFVAKLYGLNSHDLAVIDDTLANAMPYQTHRRNAARHPDEHEVERYATKLEKLLRPFLSRSGKSIHVFVSTSTDRIDNVSPYRTLLIHTGHDDTASAEDVRVMFESNELGNQIGASRVIVPQANGLVISILNQRRYWTESAARLCASEVLQRYLPLLEAAS